LKKTKLCTGLMVACGGVLLSAGSASFAQPAPAPAPQSLERVEITGSNIKRADAETASPVQVISKQEIDQAGKGTVAEYLQTLTADGQGSVPFTYGRGFSGATAAGISLRGLGANATLVLINGRRVTTAVLADDAQRTYVDLNQIPMEAVERIEVVKDGASAIYGSDAVAGVVNIILRKNFVGAIGKATYGVSGDGDGNEARAALTYGTGDLTKEGYNLLLNVEVGKKDSIFYRDRVGRGSVGVSAIGQPQWGFDPNAGPSNNIPRQGGNGWIPVNPDGSRVNNSTSPSIIGNVRNPNTLDYYSRSDPGGVGFTRTFPGAATYCGANANLPQNNPAGACIYDQRQFVSQVQPDQDNGSFFGRFTKQVTPEIQGFVELSAAYAKTSVVGLPIAPSNGYFTPDGVVHSQVANAALGPAHPDNPYFGTEARLSYMPQFDTGNTEVNSKSHTERFVAGLQGTWQTWDFDTGVVYSSARQQDVSTKTLNWRVSNALLNPTAANVAAATAFSPAYAALPAGTYWRIGENAGLNSPALYQALLADNERNGYSKLYGADFKLSKEVGQLQGGGIGVAFGAEIRREDNELPFYTGLGDYAGLSLTSYGGARNIYAGYGEIVAPVLKTLELNAALRYDYYTDAGASWTPKFGAKWKAIDNLALRGTYSKAFRAPSSTENSASSIAAFGGASINDNARCASLAGLPQATIDANCLNVAPTFIQSGNPDLKPEKATTTTLGLVWDITAKASVTADWWQIKRTGLPVIEDPQAAVDAGRVVRDPATKLTAGDLGAILNGSVVFQNSSKSTTEGFDVDAKGRWTLPSSYGSVTTGANWTHLLTQTVVDAAGVEHAYAGTHGDCNITNCMGSPRDRVSFYATWEMAQWRLGANINYRGDMTNKLEQADTACAQQTADGADFPGGCKLKSFTTMDVSAAWKFGKNSEIFGSIQNVFDTKPPTDFLTYGAIGYNPLDYAGAIGRFFRIGVKHQF
jgi:iron complex outermembrane receptor protein